MARANAGGRARYALAFSCVGAVVSQVACSALEDFDGYTGGGAPTTMGDAEPPSDAAASDAVVDATTDARADASSADAGSDAAASDASIDSAPTGFCASKSPAPLFCDDFDTHELAVTWDWLGTQGGTPVRDTNASISPPDSLFVPIKAIAAGGGVYAIVAKQFTTFTKKPIHGVFAFELRIEAADMTNGANAIVATFQTVNSGGTSSWEVQLVAKFTGSDITLTVAEYQVGTDAGEQYQDAVIPTHVALGSWHAVQIAFTLPVVDAPPGASNSATVYLDGTAVTTLPLKFAVLPYAPEVELGSGYVAAPSDPWKLRYDDAWVDMQSP